MPAACALGMIRGKYYYICGSETPAGVSEPLFHGKGSDEKRQLQRLFPAEMRRCGGKLPKTRFPRGGCGQREQTVGYHPIFAQKVYKNI